MTVGKTWGLRRLANKQGFFSMAAIDQRPPLITFIAKKCGIPEDQVTVPQIAELKGMLAQGLAPHCSALLVDPDYGYAAAAEFLRPDRGLLLTLEDHRFTETPQGRISHDIPNWSVDKIRRAGADAVKVLAWYRPDASDDVLAAQHAYAQRAGDACAAHGIPYILELLVYPFPGSDKSFTDYREDPEKQADHVIDSVREFAKPEYQVDLLKLESPIAAPLLPDPHTAGASKTQAIFDEMGKACRGLPWVMLSAGATFEDFKKAMVYASRAGASGFLAGRALWADLIAPYPSRTAVVSLLDATGGERISELQAIVAQHGVPVQPTYPWSAAGSTPGTTSEPISGPPSGEPDSANAASGRSGRSLSTIL